MQRETKTLAELEEMLLARLRELPNGELVEGVSIVLPEREHADPGVGVGWNETGANMRPIISHAITYAGLLCRQYEVLEG